MSKRGWIFIFVAVAALGFLVGVWLANAQTMPVVLLVAPAGTTIANCGTPTTPSLCAVGTGIYVWQNATQGWFLIAPPAATTAGVTDLTVCNANGSTCGTAQTGSVKVNVPAAAATTATTTLQ